MVRTPFQIKKIFKPLLRSGNKKFKVTKSKKCGIRVKRLDKKLGWGNKLVVKVEYKRNESGNIKTKCQKFSPFKLNRFERTNKKLQEKLNMRLE